MVITKVDDYNNIEWYRHIDVYANSQSRDWCAFLNGDCIIEIVPGILTEEDLHDIAREWISNNW